MERDINEGLWSNKTTGNGIFDAGIDGLGQSRDSCNASSFTAGLSLLRIRIKFIFMIPINQYRKLTVQ